MSSLLSNLDRLVAFSSVSIHDDVERSFAHAVRVRQDSYPLLAAQTVFVCKTVETVLCTTQPEVK